MLPDRTPHPGLTEVKKSYSSIKVEPVDLLHGKVRFVISTTSSTWDSFAASGRCRRTERHIQSGDVPQEILRRDSKRMSTLNFKQPTPVPGAEYFLTVSFESGAGPAWAPKGHVVSWDQFKVPFEVAPAPVRALIKSVSNHTREIPGALVAPMMQFLDCHQRRVRVRSPRTTSVAVNS